MTIGKLHGWGLGAGGKDGLAKVLELLEEELVMSVFAHIPGSGQLR